MSFIEIAKVEEIPKGQMKLSTKSKLRIKVSRSIPKLVKSPNYFKILIIQYWLGENVLLQKFGNFKKNYYNELFLIVF